MLLLIAVCLSGSALFLGWQAGRKATVPMLLPRGAGRWIVYPKPFSRSAQRRIPMTTTFRHAVRLNKTPPRATLELRAYQQAELTINGAAVNLDKVDESSWKRTKRHDVARWLTKGENRLEVRATSDFGPPAIWLSLDLGTRQVVSGSDWKASLAGAAWQEACVASRLIPSNQSTRDHGVLPRVSQIAGRLWPRYAAGTTIIALAVAIFFRWWSLRDATQSLWLRADNAVWITVALIAAAWVVLFVNNMPWLYRSLGYDALAHLEYIDYLLHYHRVPLANEGWEMYHPPLYYITAAALLGAGGLSTTDAAGMALIRGLGLVTGLATVALVAGCLKLLLPHRPHGQVAGTLLAGLLPGQLALSHYPANELFCTAFSAAALLLLLGELRSPLPSKRRGMLLGACLGAALLSKVTGLIPTVVVLIVLAGRLVFQRKWRLGAWWQSLGVVVLATVLVSGWHYGRVWYRLGSPFAMNVDAAYRVWQDPGIHTPWFYVRFGRCLSHPFFSGASSWGDGLYTTLWGDGNLGGSRISSRPPWNYDAMVSGYWLAIVPSVVLLIGAGIALVRFVRRPSAAWFAVWGIIYGVVLFIIYGTMFAPWFSTVKGTYMLPALVGFVALAGLGFDWLTQKRGLAGLLWVLWIVWAVNAYASFWIHGGTATTHVRIGRALAERERRMNQAAAHYRRALKLNPKHAEAHEGLADVLAARGHFGKARQHYLASLEADADNARCQWDLSVLLFQLGETDRAWKHAQRAIDLPPAYWTDHEPRAGALALQAQIIGRQHDVPKRIALYGQVLRLRPQNAVIHIALARAYAQLHQLSEAREHYVYALAVQPDNAAAMAGMAEVLDQTGHPAEAVAFFQRALKQRPTMSRAATALAWILATDSSAAVRDARLAMRWGEAAVRMTAGKDPAALDALAAALARSGRFDLAGEKARQALRIAEQHDNTRLATEIRQRIKQYDQLAPFRRPSPREPSSDDSMH